jgi:two-component system sensor histidine kinase BaeS
MRLRLFVGFLLVILVTLTAVAVFARQGATTQVHTFMGRGGWYGGEDLVAELEAFYGDHGTWQGVESIFAVRHGPGTGMGMGRGSDFNGMMPAWRLAALDGSLVYDPVGAGAQRLSSQELQGAVILTADGSTVGYLLTPPEMPAPDQNFEAALIQRIYRASLNAAFIAGGISLILALLLVTLLLKPVNQLSAAAVRLARGDLSQRVETRGAKELVVLGDSFNFMAESLQRAEASRRAMTADIAHELRTPLAVQRAHLEALQDGIYPLTQDNLEVVLRQNQLLHRLVEDLRTLALADAGELRLEKQVLNLADLAADAVEGFKGGADQVGIGLELHIGSPCANINADPQRIQQILHNLLHNAQRHTPEGGKIDLFLTCGGSEARLSVQDSGVGIPPAALPHIFERFYRADPARSHAEGGSGLGLAIARRLAELHGGKLEAANQTAGGAVFTLTLPL